MEIITHYVGIAIAIIIFIIIGMVRSNKNKEK